MSVQVLGAYPLGVINVSANGAVALVAPMMVQVDLMLTGPFGLGSLLVDLSAQLNASLSLQVQVSNPFDILKSQLSAILRIQAGIQASLALGLPALSAKFAVRVDVAAKLSLRVGGLKLLIEAALAVKIPLVSFIADLAANLSAGPVVLLSVGYSGPDTLSSAGTQLNSMFQTGVGGILPGEQVFGVVLVTKSLSASVALSAILKTS